MSVIRISILLLFMLSSYIMEAQIMEWVIRPTYRDVVPMGGDLFKVKGSNGKWGVYNVTKGELIVSAEYDSITSLVEGRALILDRTGQYLYGILSENGFPIQPLRAATTKPDFVVVPDYPYYSEGLLAVGNISSRGGNSLFGYVDKQGKVVISFEHYYACPFDNDIAMVMTRKKTYRIINKHGVSQYQGNDNIRFISNPDEGEFLLVTDNKIRKARLEGNKFKTVKNINTGGRIVDVADATLYNRISCRGGDTYRFDKALRYIENGNERDYFVRVSENSHNLTKVKSGRMYGLCYGTMQLLTEQFREAYIYKDEYALVTLNDGTKGVLQYNPTGKITITALNPMVEFAHNNSQNVSVNVACVGLYNTKPVVELTHNGVTEKCSGSGQVHIPVCDSHDKPSNVTSKRLAIDITVDKLILGSRILEVKTMHKEGYKLGNVNIPAYSNMNGSANVSVTIYAVGGTPSSSARATVNGITKEFRGQNSLTFNIPFSVPSGGTKAVNINVRVTEDGCPTWTANQSGTIQHLSRK